MELNPRSPSFLLTISVGVVTILLVLRRLWQWRRLPPGPWGLPIVGCFPFVKKDLHRYLTDLADTYGPILSLRFGTKLHVSVSSPAIVAEMLKTNDLIFANHFVPSLTNQITGAPNILFAPYGPYWRMARKVAVHEVLSNAVINSLAPLRRREVQRLLERLRSRAGNVVDVRETAFSVLISVLLGMVWEDALLEEKGSLLGKKLLEIFDGINDVINFFNIADYFPVLATLDLQGLYRKMTMQSDRLQVVLDAIIEQRLERNANGGRGSGPRDFLQILLDLLDKKDPQVPLEMGHIKGTMLEMLFSGSDTTASTLEWVMTSLARNPRVMAKAQEELDAVVGRGCSVEESHLPKLPYLSAIIKETMRLESVVPLLVPRYPSETCTIGGYTIPKGTTVFVNMWKIQRDPSIFKDPLEFRPERFLEKPDRWDLQGTSFEYMPFGGGRRTCPGPYLAERLMTYIVASLLHAFRWEIPEGMTVDVDDKLGVTRKKKDPLLLVPFCR